jgi:hypothetical protein
MGVSGQHHAPAAIYPRGKDPRYPFYRRLGGPQSREKMYKIINLLAILCHCCTYSNNDLRSFLHYCDPRSHCCATLGSNNRGLRHGCCKTRDRQTDMARELCSLLTQVGGGVKNIQQLYSTVHRPGDDPRKECEECGNVRGSNVRYYPT